MEDKLQIIIDYIDKSLKTIDSLGINPISQGYAIGTLETIKTDLETLKEIENEHI